MNQIVQVKPDYSGVNLPDGSSYPAGATILLTDAQFAALNSAQCHALFWLDTSNYFATSNPVVPASLTTVNSGNARKIGDGVTHYNSLPTQPFPTVPTAPFDFSVYRDGQSAYSPGTYGLDGPLDGPVSLSSGLISVIFTTAYTTLGVSGQPITDPTVLENDYLFFHSDKMTPKVDGLWILLYEFDFSHPLDKPVRVKFRGLSMGVSDTFYDIPAGQDTLTQSMTMPFVKGASLGQISMKSDVTETATLTYAALIMGPLLLAT